MAERTKRPHFLHSEDNYRAVWSATYGAAYALYSDRFRGSRGHIGHARELAIETADAAVAELRRSARPESEREGK